MKSIPRALRLRLAIGFFERFVGSMMTPLMMVYLAEETGPAVAGALLVGVVAVGVAAGLAGGHFSDRNGRRRVMLAGGSGMGLAFVGVAGAHLMGWPFAAYGCYLVLMAAMTSIQPAHEAMIIDLVPRESRRAVYTLNYWANNLALAVGALVGAFFYRDHFPQLLLCYAAGIFAAVALSFRFLAESAPPGKPADAAGAGRPWPSPRGLRIGVFLDRYRGVAHDRRFLVLVVVMIAIMGLEFQNAGYLGTTIAAALPAGSVDLPFLPGGALGGVELVGVLRAESTVLVVVLALIAGPALRRLGNAASIYTGTALFTVGYFFLAVFSRPGQDAETMVILLVLATAVATFGEIVHVPAMQSMMAEIIPDHARSRYMAVFGLNPKGGQLIGAGCLSLGALVPSVGMGLIFALLGIVALVASWLVLTWEQRATGEPEPELEMQDQR